MIAAILKYCFVSFQLSTELRKENLCVQWKFPIHSWWQAYSEWPRKNIDGHIYDWNGCDASIAIKTNEQLQKLYFPCIWSVWPWYNKKCMVEMVILLHQNHQSDKTKWQDHHKSCVDESNCGENRIAVVVFVLEAIGLWWWKRSWCGSILQWFWLCRWYVFYMVRCNMSVLWYS